MNTLKKIKSKIVNVKSVIVFGVTALYLNIFAGIAYATDNAKESTSFTLATGTTAEELGNKAITSLSTVLKITGGVVITAAIALGAIGLIMSKNNANKRTENINQFGWILVGGFILGALSLFAGFAFNLGA